MGETRGAAIPEIIWARVIGQEVLKFIKDSDPEKLDRRINCEALILLERIRSILDDDILDDPECFRRIEAIVDAFDASGIPTARHDW